MKTRSQCVAVAVVVLTGLSIPANATDWTVCAAGCDFSNIQAAVSAAVTGDSVSVKAGVYTGTGTAAVTIAGKGIILNAVDGPDFTFIDGQSLRTCLRVDASGGNESTIKGFTFINGQGPFGPPGYGGGVHVNAASPTIRNCVFQNNRADDGAGLHVVGTSTVLVESSQFLGNIATLNGGGAYVRSLNPVTFLGCHFDGNHALRGAGGGIHFIDNTSGSISVCNLDSNTATASGGGAFLGSNTLVAVSTCDFLNNTTGADGGGVRSNSQFNTFQNCTFKANLADGIGGGLYVYAGLMVTIDQCSFTSNVAASGGGLANYTSSPELVSCEFFANQADDGGALYNFKSLPTLTHCHLLNNGAINGGAVYDRDSDPFFDHCVIEDNQADSGGACYENDSRAQFIKTTLQSNTAAVGGGGIYVGFGTWSPSISGCLLRDNASPTDGGGIESYSSDTIVIDNTRFCGNTTDHISAASLWSDAGDVFFLEECPDCVGDANGDWVVDLDDFSVLLIEFGSSGVLASDFDDDGDVDINDFSLLLISFGIDCWDESALRAGSWPIGKRATTTPGRILKSSR